MAASKIAITIDQKTLTRLDRLVKEHVYPNRSKAIQAALHEKLIRLETNRLAIECDKLDSMEEKILAEEGFSMENETRPEY
ncbi:MAG: ribbon-helix-helix protein, CopG family [Spirochaetales bacterium]|nr:ribbon-helix-helix protein, CopG family [Spirochaetales bacterium]